MCRIGVVAKNRINQCQFCCGHTPPFSVTGKNIHLIDKKLVNIDIYMVGDSISLLIVYSFASKNYLDEKLIYVN